MADHGWGSEDGTHGATPEASANAEASANVVPFPRSWYGAADELVPIPIGPPAVDPDPSEADATAFWGGDPRALDARPQADVDAAPSAAAHTAPDAAAHVAPEAAARTAPEAVAYAAPGAGAPAAPPLGCSRLRERPRPTGPRIARPAYAGSDSPAASSSSAARMAPRWPRPGRLGTRLALVAVIVALGVTAAAVLTGQGLLRGSAGSAGSARHPRADAGSVTRTVQLTTTVVRTVATTRTPRPDRSRARPPHRGVHRARPPQRTSAGAISQAHLDPSSAEATPRARRNGSSPPSSPAPPVSVTSSASSAATPAPGVRATPSGTGGDSPAPSSGRSPSRCAPSVTNGGACSL